MASAAAATSAPPAPGTTVRRGTARRTGRERSRLAIVAGRAALPGGGGARQGAGDAVDRVEVGHDACRQVVEAAGFHLHDHVVGTRHLLHGTDPLEALDGPGRER